ncbi:two-component sensor histidine kinase [Gandjariella thermophila]|uniref:histidine kinase n=1 Tax=Gandjariella thermophila TaxID=1931992 RepID=A0A4D4J907_9PSEU|nr:two-component sensor histidine kinase [Gandjariella thermophila]
MDVLLALALMVFVVGVTVGVARWHQPAARPVDPLGVAWLAAGGLPLPWRRRYPVAVFVLSAALTFSYYVSGYPGGPDVVFPVLALFTVALVRGPVRGAAAGVALWGAALVLALLRDASVLAPWLGGLLLGILAVVAAGSAVRNRYSALRATRERFEAEARRRAEEERLRVAREVHDVVAHSLAMINVQAGVAAHVADRRPEQARQALLAIKEASRTALADLRATLGVLRSGEDRAPAPSLNRMAELLDQVRAAGLRVEVAGEPGDLPAPVDVAGYRILQESLTNAVRHARGATTVTVRWSRAGDDLELAVRDDGQAAAVAPGGTGSGLRGMRERAEALGGRLSAGPAPGGGFEVRAVLPLGADTGPRDAAEITGDADVSGGNA